MTLKKVYTISIMTNNFSYDILKIEIFKTDTKSPERKLQ
jgi:hypothetical protein